MSRRSTATSLFRCTLRLPVCKQVAMRLTRYSISEQPFKIPYVAAVVLHANNNKPDVAAEVLKRTAEFCQQHIEAGNWRIVKLILRFLACLSGLYSDEGVFPILDELFNRAVDLQTASAEDVSCVLSRCFGSSF